MKDNWFFFRVAAALTTLRPSSQQVSFLRLLSRTRAILFCAIFSLLLNVACLRKSAFEGARERGHLAT